MKVWLPILILLFAVTGLCIWDGVHTQKVFDQLEAESQSIYETLLESSEISSDIESQIFKLNDYWTDEMDALCISLSRKDLQPISDYLQYLCASCINDNHEDAITYSRILNYNIVGLSQTTGISALNLL